ncbi:hypothetical protein EYF80_018400 [Liparis tanakae]|uniref:Uncharacterized protein n=1 Tax=Liparis tanakae TaxID=230148 RepID=A0A4Z2I272_9TELE|nr:hypothetical protein EYF80_018400 [Liparis tanakae]
MWPLRAHPKPQHWCSKGREGREGGRGTSPFAGIIQLHTPPGVVGIITDHHVVSPGQRRTDSDLFLGLIAVLLRLRELTGTVSVIQLAVLLPSHESLERRREPAGSVQIRRRPGRLLLLLLLLLLGHTLVRGVRMSHVRITNDVIVRNSNFLKSQSQETVRPVVPLLASSHTLSPASSWSNVSPDDRWLPA